MARSAMPDWAQIVRGRRQCRLSRRIECAEPVEMQDILVDGEPMDGYPGLAPGFGQTGQEHRCECLPPRRGCEPAFSTMLQLIGSRPDFIKKGRLPEEPPLLS